MELKELTRDDYNLILPDGYVFEWKTNLSLKANHLLFENYLIREKLDWEEMDYYFFLFEKHVNKIYKK